MAKTNSGNIEKNLISRRTLLNNSLLTGLSVAAGFYLTKSSYIPHTTTDRLDFKNGGKNSFSKSNIKSQKDSYIDNFDC